MKIRVGTFNLFQFAEPPYAWYTKKEKFTPKAWSLKTAWIKKQIQAMACDIIGFQEVFSQEALATLVKEMGFEYFETADTAKLSQNNPKKYVTTTVAIASKYPITKTQKVRVHPPSLKEHHFQGRFRFSRLPIKATISLPNDQELLVYVCHLKSNRTNAFEYSFNATDTLEKKQALVLPTLQDKHSVALQQRLCEASSLFFDMRKSKNRPTLLLCDLNDKAHSLTIEALTNYRYHDPKREEESLLYDAYTQHTPKEVYNPHPEAKPPQRKPTSYFLGRGNILDYIFLSRDFLPSEEQAIAQVSDYSVLDAHLHPNKDGSLLTSDHAQVVCELSFE